VDDVTWAEKVDSVTGRPVPTALYTKAVAGEAVTYWPSAFGGKNWAPMAFSPDTGLAYANTFRVGMNYAPVEPRYRAGTFFFGVDFNWEWPQGHRGELRAIEPTTGAIRWRQPVDIPRNAGVLATAGGVVFTGTQTGEFEAFDARTGEQLWQFQTGSGIVGQPMTWEQDGRQYVSILSGSGGIYLLFAGDERLAAVPSGGAVWTFALPAD